MYSATFDLLHDIPILYLDMLDNVRLGEDLMTWNISDSTQLEHAIFEMKYRLVRGIGVRQGMTVVDAGCGQGGFTVSLARVVGETGRVLSVDISEEYFGEFTGNLKKWDVARWSRSSKPTWPILEVSWMTIMAIWLPAFAYWKN